MRSVAVEVDRKERGGVEGPRRRDGNRVTARKGRIAEHDQIGRGRSRRAGQDQVERGDAVEIGERPVRGARGGEDDERRRGGDAACADHDDMVVRRAAEERPTEDVGIAVAVEVAHGQEIRRLRRDRGRERSGIEREHAAAGIPPEFLRHAARGRIREDEVEIAVRFEIGDEHALRDGRPAARRGMGLRGHGESRGRRENTADVQLEGQRAEARARAQEQIEVAVGIEVDERERTRIDDPAVRRAGGGRKASEPVVQEHARGVEEVRIAVQIDVSAKPRRATERDLPFQRREERRRDLGGGRRREDEPDDSVGCAHGRRV